MDSDRVVKEYLKRAGTLLDEASGAHPGTYTPGQMQTIVVALMLQLENS